MATPFTTSTGSASISASEFSLVNGSTTPAASTTANEIEVLLDLSAMIAGDQYQVRVVDKVNGGTAQNIWIAFPTGVQAGLFRIPATRVNEGWDVRVKLITGSARTLAWSLKQDVGDVNALTLGSGAVTAAAIASSAITAAKFATDAIDSNALATSAVTKIQTGLPLATDYTAARAAKIDNLDATVSSRAPSATALSTVQWTNARAAEIDNLDTTVSSRAASATALSTVQWTNTRAGNLDNLDAAVSTRAPSATAVSNADFTSARATKLDNLDATTSSRAPASTALSTATWTNLRAADLDNLDAAVSSRASAALVTSATASLQADTDDIQSRLPAALDASGNIKAGVQSLIAGAIASIADAVMNYVIEAAPVNATTHIQRMRVLWSLLVGKGSGFAITTAGTEHVRDAADTKDRATWTLATDGTRVPGTIDGT